jgi:preprotein translocase subunit SecE
MPTTEKAARFKIFGDVRDELKKVTWLTRREAVYLTGLVLIFSAVIGLLLGGLDYLFSFLIKQFVGG